MFYFNHIYLHRAAIAEAPGKASSYKSNFANWETKGHKDSFLKRGLPYLSYARKE